MSSNSNKTCLVAEGLCQENGYEFNEELQHEENDEDNRVNLKCALPT